MRYCEKCGTPNADDAKFCRKCGNRFKAGSSYLKYILLLVIVCVFIVVCIISFGVTQQTVLPLADQEASSVSSDIVKDSEFDTEAKIEASSLDKDENVNLEDYLKDLSWTQDELKNSMYLLTSIRHFCSQAYVGNFVNKPLYNYIWEYE